MRAHKLLSPHRGRQGTARVHAGTIVTQAPNVMWGTDGVRVFTLDDGWGWIFTAVEHWNAECVGWHVCKGGSRFAALEPIAQGLRRIYGALDADSARGLALRMDHGSQYLSDHFLNQIRYWGMRPSYGFVEEPETNGVAERWNRTLKEQATHGRIFQNLKEVRAAVPAFVERYNTTWRLEKLGYHTPDRGPARRTSYAGRRSVNLCPKNWVRYTYNTEPPPGRATLRSFRGVVRHHTAHCLEAVLAAAVVLEQHGYPPLALSFESVDQLGPRPFCLPAPRPMGLGGPVARPRTARAQARVRNPAGAGAQLCRTLRRLHRSDHRIRDRRPTGTWAL